MATSAISTEIIIYKVCRVKIDLQEYPQQFHDHPTELSHQMCPSIAVYVHEIVAHHRHLDFSDRQYICLYL